MRADSSTEKSRAWMWAMGCTIAGACHVGMAATPERLEKVTIEGDGSSSNSQQSNSLRSAFTRKEIVKYGDSSVADVLARIPGVTVTSGPQREIRLRGMSAGYTQLLLNGEPVPQGFSIDSIDPTIIEKIEIQRTASADTSTQAIAGSINIILAKKSPAGKREARLSLSEYAGKPGASGSFSFSERIGKAVLFLPISVSLEHSKLPTESLIKTFDGKGKKISERETDSLLIGKTKSVGISPRISTSLIRGDLALDGLLQFISNDFSGHEHREVISGLAFPRFSDNEQTVRIDSPTIRLGAAYKKKFNESSQLELKFNMSRLQRKSWAQFSGRGYSPQDLLLRTVDSDALDSTKSTGIKYVADINEENELAIGAEIQKNKRRDSRVQTESNSLPGFIADNLDERYVAHIDRFSAYAQNDFLIGKDLSFYGGLRWERMAMETSGTGFQSIARNFSLTTPIAQVIWRPLGNTTYQVRASFSRTFRTPSARDLIPRRWVVNDNSPTSPDFEGNPSLIPEISTGIDVSNEFRPSKSSAISATFFAKNIDNAITNTLFQRENTWVSRPENAGRARHYGVEVDSRYLFGPGIPWLEGVDLKISHARYESRFLKTDIGASGLKDQPLFATSLTFDRKISSIRGSIGGNIAITKYPLIASNHSYKFRAQERKTADFYVLMGVGSALRTRLALANAAAPSLNSSGEHSSSGLSSFLSQDVRTYRTFRVSVEADI